MNNYLTSRLGISGPRNLYPTKPPGQADKYVQVTAILPTTAGSNAPHHPNGHVAFETCESQRLVWEIPINISLKRPSSSSDSNHLNHIR